MGGVRCRKLGGAEAGVARVGFGGNIGGGGVGRVWCGLEGFGCRGEVLGFGGVGWLVSFCWVGSGCVCVCVCVCVWVWVGGWWLVV